MRMGGIETDKDRKANIHMSSTGTTMTQTLADMYRTGGNWSQVYMDVSVDSGDPVQIRATRRESVVDALRRSGAPDADVESIQQIMDEDPGVPSPVCRFLLAQDGTVVVNQIVPGLPVEAEIVSFGAVPDVIPLLKHQPEEFSYLVVETSRDGGEVRLYRAGAAGTVSEDQVKGRTDTLHKAHAGGWRQDRNQDHVEEIWKQTQSQLATTVDEIVRTRHPRLLVVAGDIRARQLLADELSAESRAILAIEPTNTRADGASDEALVDRINEEIERVLQDDKSDVVDRLEIHKGRGDNTVEFSFGAIVQALAAAQVDTLVMDTARLRDHPLLALDAEPWIAAAPEDALNASVLKSVPAPVAMVRAAVLTDARVLFADSSWLHDGTGEAETAAIGPNAGNETDSDADSDSASEEGDAGALPDNAAAAALLRWRTGPPVPGT
ncbi:MAG: hypothetical protein JWQ59_155 [Cryobacterium sp.]|nr:hypothetical protein [Cryobacterium sp.]